MEKFKFRQIEEIDDRLALKRTVDRKIMENYKQNEREVITNGNL